MIRPLVTVFGGQHSTVSCRDCGDLGYVTYPQSMTQAGLVQRRHLAEHLTALTEEVTEAAR